LRPPPPGSFRSSRSRSTGRCSISSRASCTLPAGSATKPMPLAISQHALRSGASSSTTSRRSGGIAPGRASTMLGALCAGATPTGRLDARTGTVLLASAGGRLVRRRRPLEIGRLLRDEGGQRRLGDDLQTAACLNVGGQRFIEGSHELLGVTGST